MDTSDPTLQGKRVKINDDDAYVGIVIGNSGDGTINIRHDNGDESYIGKVNNLEVLDNA